MPTGNPPRSRDPTRALRLAIAGLCGELLPDMIGITDAFGFRIGSLIVRWVCTTGRHTRHSGQGLQHEPLNQTEVTEAYEVGGSAQLGGQSNHLNQKSGVFGNELSTLSTPNTLQTMSDVSKLSHQSKKHYGGSKKAHIFGLKPGRSQFVPVCQLNHMRNSLMGNDAITR
ncbi:hypothetical protein B0H14DRAFT_2591909 [Mycena olivaceomarginata]|nr:hypothetical protein B0H14DRAFT_2591909 [Mycena olivaceomarginata]